MKRGIIAIKLREDDELVDVVVTSGGDELVLSTASGMAIRFCQDDLRPLGRNSSGVKGINLVGDDRLVGMVVADPDATLLTVCENGYGKRTFFGPNAESADANPTDDSGADDNGADDETLEEAHDSAEGEGDEELSSSNRYRTQKRGGKGLRDIKATERNGQVIAIARVDDDDEVLMMTSRGKIQRVAAAEINTIGRNTQGVRIMNIDEGDTLAALVRVPKEENDDEELTNKGQPSGAPSVAVSATDEAAAGDTATADSPNPPEAAAEESPDGDNLGPQEDESV